MRKISYSDDRECPESIEDQQLAWFKKDTDKSFKKIVTELKKQGWKIDPEYDAEVNYTDSWEYGAANHTYFFAFSIKGGQRIIIDRKKIVADGHIDGEFMIIYHSDVYEEVIETSEIVGGWDTPIYEDGWYEADCPSDGIKYIEVGDMRDKIKSLDKMKWKEGQEKKIAQAITKAIFAYYSRSKWKKRGSMPNLRTAVIKLAYKKPELRSHLLPLLKEASDLLYNTLSDLERWRNPILSPKLRSDLREWETEGMLDEWVVGRNYKELVSLMKNEEALHWIGYGSNSMLPKAFLRELKKHKAMSRMANK